MEAPRKKFRDEDLPTLAVRYLDHPIRDMDTIAARPDAPQSIRDHKHYIYNVLSTLIGLKDGGVYRLAEMRGQRR